MIPARYFAQLCVDSYREDLIDQRGWRHRDADVEVLLDRAPWGVTYTWRGTDGLTDALRDLRFAVPWWDQSIGWCGAGPLKGVRALWGALQPSLRAAREDGAPVFLNGHSLGGAEASIMAGLLVAAGYPPTGLFTIGAPRPTLGGRLRRALTVANVACRRIVSDGDPVPEVPPWPWEHLCAEYRLEHPADVTPDHPSSRYLELIPPDMPAFG